MTKRKSSTRYLSLKKEPKLAHGPANSSQMPKKKIQLTSEAQSFLHHFISFFESKSVHIHCVWVFLFSLEIPSSLWFILGVSFRIRVFIVVVVSCFSYNSLHFPEVMIQFGGPFVPVIKSIRWVFKGHDSSLEWDSERVLVQVDRR
jgi:hypothetical protein